LKVETASGFRRDASLPACRRRDHRGVSHPKDGAGKPGRRNSEWMSSA